MTNFWWLGGLSCLPLGLNINTESPGTQSSIWVVPCSWILLCVSCTQGNSFYSVPPDSSTVWAQLLRHTATPALALRAVLPLAPAGGLGYKASLLSASPNPSAISVVISHCTLQVKLAEAPGYRPGFSGSYLMTFITVSQPIQDFPPPSKAEHLHFDSRVGELSLMHKVFFFSFSVFCRSLQSLDFWVLKT